MRKVPWHGIPPPKRIINLIKFQIIFNIKMMQISFWFNNPKNGHVIRYLKVFVVSDFNLKTTYFYEKVNFCCQI
jgi:hypothetical protein